MKKIFYMFIFNCLLFVVNCYAQPSITWQRVYLQPIPGRDEFGYDVCQAANQDYFIVTSIPIGNVNKSRILKLNPYGDTIWTLLTDSLDAFSITPTLDGGCVIAGDPQYTLKVDTYGNIVWKKFYGQYP